MTEPNPYSAINAFRSLYLDSLDDNDENGLKLTVCGSRVASPSEEAALGGAPFKGANAIVPDESNVFEIKWERYIAYVVKNESYSVAETNYVGDSSGVVRTYSSSNFLRYLAIDTFASPLYPGPFNHIRFICVSHVIDVAAVDTPVIRRLAE